MRVPLGTEERVAEEVCVAGSVHRSPLQVVDAASERVRTGLLQRLPRHNQLVQVHDVGVGVVRHRADKRTLSGEIQYSLINTICNCYIQYVFHMVFLIYIIKSHGHTRWEG